MTDFDFDRFLALPRLSGLRLSPDGRRLVVAVGGPDPEGKKMRSALWQVDPAGRRAAAAPDPLGGRRGRRRGVPPRRLAPLHLEPARPGREAGPGPQGPRPLAAPARRRRGAPARGARGRGGRPRGRPERPGRRLRRGDVPRRRRLRRRRRARQGPQGGRRRGAPLRERLPGPPLGPLAGAAPPPPLRRDARRRPGGAAPRAAGRAAGRRTDHVRGDGYRPGAGRVVPRRGRARRRGAPRHPRRTWSSSTWRRATAPRPDAAATPGTTPRRSPRTARTVAAIRTTFGSPDEASRVTLVAVDLATGEQRTLAADLDRWPEGPTWAPDGSARLLHRRRRRPPPRLPGRPRRRAGDAPHGSGRPGRPLPDARRRRPVRALLDDRFAATHRSPGRTDGGPGAPGAAQRDRRARDRRRPASSSG